MSTKPAHNMSPNAEQTQSKGNLHPISEATHNPLGCAHYYGTLCNAIHSSAKANVAHNFLKLKEGSVYSIKNFVVQANKEEYRKFRDHAYMIELDGTASVRKTFVKGSDVAGYVINVGRITQQKTGSRTLDFSLANDSGQAIRVPLWGGLGDALVERKTNNVGLYPVVLTAMNVKLYNNKLYLSSGFSSQILDDPQIPALKALRAENSEDEVSLSHAAVHADYSQAKEGTLENLLIWARNRRNDVRVKIDGIRTRKGWNFPSCGGEKCKKGVVCKEGSFWCQACDRAVEYPMLRFRLEPDVSDKTASTVVVMFDEPATELVKCSADSLAAANEDRIALEEVVEEDAISSNVNTYPDINIKQSKRLATKLIAAAPSKPTEERGKKVQTNSALHDHTNFEFTTSMPPMPSALTCIISLFLG
ncbi:reverse transcriptase domain-containing protein [Tanacetum coccineum]